MTEADLDTQELADRIVDCLCASLRGTDEAADQWTFAGMQDAFFRWPVVERELRRVLSALRTTQCSGDTQELADPQVVVAGKLLTIKPGAPEIALLCRAIFRASFADDEDEALVNQKYQEWEEGQAKAIRAARFVLRALGGNGSVVHALRTTQCSGDTQELADEQHPRETTAEMVARLSDMLGPDTDFDNYTFSIKRGNLRRLLAALSRPNDKTVELLREVRTDLRDGMNRADDSRNMRISILRHTIDRVLAKIDAHLKESNQ